MSKSELDKFQIQYEMSNDDPFPYLKELDRLIMKPAFLKARLINAVKQLTQKLKTKKHQKPSAS